MASVFEILSFHLMQAMLWRHLRVLIWRRYVVQVSHHITGC